ncbi:hypothetical protein NDU88_006808 [Pleurodeles waltl]|uniref:Uncharacterized protein n=1 Tax=Pleurodeles waltl TaxID=8319 RepID=A0AAV7TYN6_PLEWA|nr:hypothetical protein NDU88_006808 [Pleurodeles waltl]
MEADTALDTASLIKAPTSLLVEKSEKGDCPSISMEKTGIARVKAEPSRRGEKKHAQEAWPSKNPKGKANRKYPRGRARSGTEKNKPGPPNEEELHLGAVSTKNRNALWSGRSSNEGRVRWNVGGRSTASDALERVVLNRFLDRNNASRAARN